LSVNERLPLAEPPAVGVNVTATVQVPEAGTGVDAEHVVPVAAIANGPEVAMAVKVRLAFPVFVSVTVCAPLVLFTNCAENMSALDRLATGPVPVPLKLTVCGLPPALSAIVRVPLRLPTVVGTKAMLITQLLPAATGALVLHVVPEASVKSPVTDMALMANAKVPVFLRVTDWARLVVPTAWLSKATLVTESPAMGFCKR
jgi:hypothetical protein